MVNKDFYNSLSSNYNLMINFNQSLKNKTASLKYFIEPNYKNALDVGCGTGVDSIALSKLGLKVDGIDPSEEMLERAKSNSKKKNSHINFIQSGIAEFNTDQKYDLIVSLGNTIANISQDELRNLFEKLSNILTQKGKAVIQIINFSSLPKSGEFLINHFKNDNVEIIRKYFISNNNIDFIVEIVNNNKSEKIATKIFSYSYKDFEILSRKNNLSICKYGNLNKEVYSKEQSKNLVIKISKRNNTHHI